MFHNAEKKSGSVKNESYNNLTVSFLFFIFNVSFEFKIGKWLTFQSKLTRDNMCNDDLGNPHITKKLHETFTLETHSSSLVNNTPHHWLSGSVLKSVDGRCWIQFLFALVALAVLSFQWCSEKLS